METWVIIIIIILAIVAEIGIAIGAWKAGYYHGEIKLWAFLLFLIFGSLLSAVLYVAGAYKREKVDYEKSSAEASLCSECGFQIFPENKICPNCQHDVSNETKPFVNETTVNEPIQKQPQIAVEPKNPEFIKKKEKLQELKELYDEKLITGQDYEIARRKIIESE